MIQQTDLAGSFTLTGTTMTVNRMWLRRNAACWPGCFWPPRDVDAAVAVLREAVKPGVNHIDTSDYCSPHVTNQNHQAGAASVSRRSRNRQQTGRSPRYGQVLDSCL